MKYIYQQNYVYIIRLDNDVENDLKRISVGFYLKCRFGWNVFFRLILAEELGIWLFKGSKTRVTTQKHPHKDYKTLFKKF